MSSPPVSPPPQGRAQASASVVPPRRRMRRFLSVLPYLLSVLVLGVFFANLAWIASGDGNWKPAFERNGVVVESRKARGQANYHFRATMRSEYTLNQLVGGLIENATLDNCLDNIPGCMDMQVISPFNPATMSDTVLWKLELPGPFLPREAVMRSYVKQDPATGTVTVDIIAAPNAAPRSPGAVRLTHIQNRWTYRPLGGGQTEIQFLQDIDMGGFFPVLLMNLGGAEQTYAFLHDQLPGLLERDAVTQARYEFIREIP